MIRNCCPLNFAALVELTRKNDRFGFGIDADADTGTRRHSWSSSVGVGEEDD
jgi:hypothetical protein